ncbi:methionine adenosyltransferase [Subdoligranulum sp. AM23-21AC]|uniref:methionine adenosyltransferase n=1 Tax=Ruthenibacterium lactatiformans TaxID=1550024 RepID=UPI000E3EEFB7|nr:methionine adenosyltransferase [Ruthenibacterium lactatiformans]MDU5534199.1 methionine adenosyltransferase [Oscillospiraceae bacterium]RGD15912.1 methionine adenosyltransferase [Subdoligranulum sp. AM23-21AC]RJV91564.1 methionine adenosyltransferase [Subdoligranulum sp. AF14-43]RJW23142.1 methionine adenosyltransferase [Subdoligranulum sp. TF05-17AC]MCQ5090203.1 methionine adenosyltransferase [Ruthenibacterium lactatiformans]
MKKYYTAESVTEGHPDKLCDIIADSMLDDCLAHDPASHVACEVLATRGHITVAGETSSRHIPRVPGIVERVLRDVGYQTRGRTLDVLLHRQSPDIAAGVNNPLEERNGQGTGRQIGAGDQGVMVGYACDETPERMPLAVMLAHRITHGLAMARKTGQITELLPDGKAQITVEYEDGRPVRLDTVIVSAQHHEDAEIERLAQAIRAGVLTSALRALPPDEDTRILINPSGRFVLGGPDADTGLTGRKLMVDSYGPFAPHGGGAFSGKDATKVDRSGAYMARYIARNIVAARLASRCQVTLAYAIGVVQPVMVEVDTFGTGTLCADDCLAIAVRHVFDLTPLSIIRTLQLTRPIFAKTACYGHFGRADFPWEREDRIKALQDAVL